MGSWGRGQRGYCRMGGRVPFGPMKKFKCFSSNTRSFTSFLQVLCLSVALEAGCVGSGLYCLASRLDPATPCVTWPSYYPVPVFSHTGR